MNRKRALGLVAVGLVSIVLLGGAAQITRDEFDGLAKKVRDLEAKVVVLDLQVKRLDGALRAMLVPAQAQKPADAGEWSEVVTWTGYGRTRTQVYRSGPVGTFNPAGAAGLGGGAVNIPLTGIKRSFTVSAPWRVRWETNGTDWLKAKGSDGQTELLLIDAQGAAANVTAVYPNPGQYQLEILAPSAQWYSITVEQQSPRGGH